MSNNRTVRNGNWKGGRHLSNGYVFILVGPNEYKQEHILVVERAIGHELPEEAEVHHFNENRSDNSNSNLVACQDRTYHRLLHRRQRVLASGGDPDTQAICSRCKTPKEFAGFYASRNHADGRNTTCRECVKTKNRSSWNTGTCRDCGSPCDRDCARCRSCWRTFKRAEIGD